MDIVDSQVHLGPGGIAEMLAAMDALGIKAVLVDEAWIREPGWKPGYVLPNGAYRAISPTAELAALTHPDRFSYVVRVDRRDPDVRSIVRRARDASHLRAIRILAGLNETELTAFAAGDYDDLVAAAADCALPVFVGIPGHAPLVRRYAEKFRSAKFIVDHCGMPLSDGVKRMLAAANGVAYVPDPTPRDNAAEFEKVLRLADCPNVALKWAHPQSLFEVSGYPFAPLRPILRRFLNSFGAERIMWASDYSANPTGESWAELLYWHMNNPDLSADERENLLGRAARKWLSWDP